MSRGWPLAAGDACHGHTSGTNNLDSNRPLHANNGTPYSCDAVHAGIVVHRFLTRC